MSGLMGRIEIAANASNNMTNIILPKVSTIVNSIEAMTGSLGSLGTIVNTGNCNFSNVSFDITGNLTNQMKNKSAMIEEVSQQTLCLGKPWLTVGDDRFVMFPWMMNWNDARALCRSCNVDLLQPKDILKVAKYLDDNFNGTQYYWAGSRGNGTHQVYPGSGDVLPTCSGCTWYLYSTHTYVGTNDCPALFLDDEWRSSGKTSQVLLSSMDSCSETYPFVLCGA
ncbi:unnamed protein product [Meganyctiphanes norvegica]|uniref:C-type lectin domain-containing protein n=1 Tax=Meganyctiphanes norvegica TaxID=48144 RepID=A0AAV2RV20_MEGNR